LLETWATLPSPAYPPTARSRPRTMPSCNCPRWLSRVLAIASPPRFQATTRRLSKRRSVPKQTGGTHDQRRSHNTKHAAFLLLGPPTALDTHQRGQGVRAHTARPTLRTGLARARRMDWKNGHQTHTGACVRHRRVEADPSQLERCGVLVKWIDMIVCRSPEPRNDRKPAVSSRVD